MWYEQLRNSLENVLNMAPLKTALGAIIAALLYKHVIMFYCFVGLVFLDCFTRWLAISHDYLVANEKKEKPSLWKSFCSISRARAAGKISSTIMRERGLSKIMVYIVAVFTSAISDKLLLSIGSQPWLVSLIIGYLTVTEALSVVENLSDAGVGSLGRIIDKIKGRI
nr:MAG TPA: holin [Caudoviricetes sp.]